MDEAVLECEAAEVLDHLISSGMLETDGEMALIGEAAEKAFGRRHFMELLSAFTSTPLFTVLDGRTEIGMVEDRLVASLDDSDGERVLALAGQNWKILSIDFKRKVIHTEPSSKHGVARWGSSGPSFGYNVAQGMRRVVLGEDPAGVQLTGRASEALEGIRAWWSPTVSATSDAVYVPVGRYRPEQAEWWAWCGTGRNQQVKAALGASASHGDVLPGELGFTTDSIADDAQLAPLDQAARYDRLRVFPEATPAQVRARVAWYDSLLADERPLPYVSPKAVHGLKFSAALPEDKAREILARRLLL